MKQYMPPFPADDPRAPHYWMQEESGALRLPVIAFVSAERRLTMREVQLLKSYVRQWIDSPAWDMNPAATAENMRELAQLRTAARQIGSEEHLRQWARLAEDIGLDPF